MTAVVYTDRFNEFWEHYPRKTAKASAFRSWQKQVDENDAFMSTAAIEDLKKRTRLKWWSPDMTKIPHGSRWINERRWEDEGWEDDVKTFGKERTPDAPRRASTVEEQVDYGFDRWQLMLNRISLSYLRLACGMTDQQLSSMLKIKAQVHKELIDGVNEEIDGADDKGKAKREMATMIADTFCRRLDAEFDLHLRDRIFSTAKKAAA